MSHHRRIIERIVFAPRNVLLLAMLASAVGCARAESQFGDDVPMTNPDDTAVVVATDAVTDISMHSDVPAPTDSSCSTGQLICNGSCTAVASDVHHCGNCVTDCTTLANVDTNGVQCVAGACVVACDQQHADCDDSAFNGCEADLASAATCGSCNTTCTAAMPACLMRNGTYVCDSNCPPTGPTRCGGVCVNTQSDASNCGACAASCQTTEVCSAGHCSRSPTVYANSTTDLYSVNVTTGAFTHIAAFAFPNDGLDHTMADLAVTADGTLYGITFEGFYQIIPMTAVCTAILDLRPLGARTNSLAVIPANGLASGSAEQLMLATTTGNLHHVILGTRMVPLLGSFTNGASASGDLAWVPSIGLVATVVNSGIESLVRVDSTNAATTTIGLTGASNNTWGLATVGTRLFGFTGDGALTSINTATGAGSQISIDSTQMWYGAANSL